MTEVEAQMAAFVAMLDGAFRRYGVATGLPAPLEAAVRAAPRDRFAHRFRLPRGDVLNDADADRAAHLATIYSDTVLVHVDRDGGALASTNSQPSYILWLVDMLGLHAGQRVLEVGSGSGWLAAVMANVVGPAGHVTGVERIADLAAQSRADLDGLGVANVTILTGDGTHGASATAPFDRVIVTAATWDIPKALFDQIAEGGRALVPIAQRGGDCQVTLLQREGDRFRALRSTLGFFVPLVGDGQIGNQAPVDLATLPFWRDIGTAPSLHHRFWLGASAGLELSAVARQFRGFLRLSEPGFALIVGAGNAGAADFGLIDAPSASVAVCRGGDLVGYGSPTAARRLASSYEGWARRGMPGPDGFDLEIVMAAAAPVRAAAVWVEPRGESALVWRLKPGAESWRNLLSG